jgi:hypothetical protein
MVRPDAAKTASPRVASPVSAVSRTDSVRPAALTICEAMVRCQISS